MMAYADVINGDRYSINKKIMDGGYRWIFMFFSDTYPDLIRHNKY